MRLLGFSAQESLYGANERYRMAGSPSSTAEGSRILPQGICFKDEAGDQICCGVVPSIGLHYCRLIKATHVPCIPGIEC